MQPCMLPQSDLPLPQAKPSPQQFWRPEISHQLPLLRMIRLCKLFSLFPTNSKSKLASQQQLNEQQEQIDMLRHLPTIRPLSKQVSASACIVKICLHSQNYTCMLIWEMLHDFIILTTFLLCLFNQGDFHESFLFSSKPKTES